MWTVICTRTRSIGGVVNAVMDSPVSLKAGYELTTGLWVTVLVISRYRSGLAVRHAAGPQSLLSPFSNYLKSKRDLRRAIPTYLCKERISVTYCTYIYNYLSSNYNTLFGEVTANTRFSAVILPNVYLYALNYPSLSNIMIIKINSPLTCVLSSPSGLPTNILSCIKQIHVKQDTRSTRTPTLICLTSGLPVCKNLSLRLQRFAGHAFSLLQRCFHSAVRAFGLNVYRHNTASFEFLKRKFHWNHVMIQSFRPAVMKQKVSYSSFVKTTDRLCTNFSVMFIRVHKYQQQAFRCTSLAQNMYDLYKLLERTVLKVRFKGDIRARERTTMTSSKHVSDYLEREVIYYQAKLKLGSWM